jgi:flagellar FliL protein
MAEEEKAAPEAAEKPEKGGKKKGKLPILIALVAVLGGGGFFAMKMKGGGAKPKVELGATVKLEEILVNLKEPSTYARTDIALQLMKGFEKPKLEEHMDAVRDAIILDLSSKSINQIRTIEGKEALKLEIAEAVNKILNEGKGSAAAKDKTKEESKDEKSAPAKREHEDWDSDTGPVLKVYFSNFATQ